MIKSYNPLSQQARAGSGRAARYEAPLSSFVSRRDLQSSAEPAAPTRPGPVTDMVEVEPGIFVSRGGSGATQNLGNYAPSDSVARTLDDADVEGLMGDLSGMVGSKLTGAGINAAAAAHAGIPALDAVKGSILGAVNPASLLPGMFFNSIDRALQRTVSENNLREMEDPRGSSMSKIADEMINAPERSLEMDDLQTTAIRDEAEKTKAGFLGSMFSDDLEPFSGHQRFSDARNAVAMNQMDESQRVDNPTSAGYLRPSGSKTVSGGGGGDGADDPNAGRPGILGSDLAMEAPRGIGHFGSTEPGLVTVGRQPTMTGRSIFGGSAYGGSGGPTGGPSSGSSSRGSSSDSSSGFGDAGDGETGW